MKALHRCDNPPCFNPAHLYEGTQADNLRDARERTGIDPRHAPDAYKKMWETRRAKYGPSGAARPYTKNDERT